MRFNVPKCVCLSYSRKGGEGDHTYFIARQFGGLTSLKTLTLERASKFVLNDYSMDYRNRLKVLKLLPLMYHLELNDIMLAVRCFKSPEEHFNLNKYVAFCHSGTRSSSHSNSVIPVLPSTLSSIPSSIDYLDCGMRYLPLTCLNLL